MLKNPYKLNIFRDTYVSSNAIKKIKGMITQIQDSG